MTSEELKERLQKELAELRTLRDQVRLDLHLAGMDARDRWAELEPRIEGAEKLAGEITETSRKAVEEIAERIRDFQRDLRH